MHSKRNIAIGLALAVLFLAAGCTAAATVAPATPAPTAAPTVAATVAPTAAPTAAPTKAAASTAPAATVAAQAFTVDAPAFKLYNLVQLGMTKDAVDKAAGQVGEAQSDSDKQNGIYTYTDDQANGVRVFVNDKNLVYAKDVSYNSPASVLGPLTPTAVTHDQYDQISLSGTYKDVVTLLGSDGVICGVEADKADCKSNLLLKRFWGNKDGSFLEVDFKEDGSIDKVSWTDYQPE